MGKLLRAIAHPLEAYKFLSCRILGSCYKAAYAPRRRRVTIGSNLQVHGSLNIHGPGRVIIGDNVTIGMQVTPWTYAKGATLTIGDNVFLNGTRFGCAESIRIGNGCILADCRILDTDFHGVDPRRRDVGETAPIVIEDNVWITMQCIVLKGVRIAAGCTITPNSVVNRSLTKPNAIYGGNPAVFIKDVG